MSCSIEVRQTQTHERLIWCKEVANLDGSQRQLKDEGGTVQELLYVSVDPDPLCYEVTSCVLAIVF